MVEKVFHWLTGCAQFRVRGDAPRFLNMAARSGFGLWGFSREGEDALSCCRPSEYPKLRPLARRCGVRVKCVGKRGLPFLACRLFRRKGLVLGTALGIGVYIFFSGFLWGVSVSGTETMGDALVLDAAASGGVYVGAPKGGLSPKGASHRIVELLPDLKWAAVNTDGCFAEIVVGERTEKPEEAQSGAWSNMVAERAGVILSVEAEEGRPEVSPGEAVEEGDLLISGLYQEQLEPWDPRAGNPFIARGAARGRVTARTYREFTVYVSARRRETVPTGERKVNRSVTLFGLRLPLGLNAAPGGEYRSYTLRSSLSALGVELPLTLERTVYEPLTEQERVLDEESLRQAALLKLREAQRADLPQGSQVLEEELVWSFPQGMCILEARCRCREEIGVIQEILVE